MCQVVHRSQAQSDDLTSTVTRSTGAERLRHAKTRVPDRKAQRPTCHDLGHEPQRLWKLRVPFNTRFKKTVRQSRTPVAPTYWCVCAQKARLTVPAKNDVLDQPDAERMYRNQRGKRFADVTTRSGFGQLQKGHGVVFADFDNDGGQDIFEQMGGFYLGDRYFDALYENPGFGNRWIGVQLVGDRSNRSAIGARIRVEVIEGSATRSNYKHINSGGIFGANPLWQSIGLGKASSIEKLEVYWPTTGKTQTVEDVPMDRFIKIEEGRASVEG